MSVKAPKIDDLFANKGNLKSPVAVAQIIKSYNTNGEVVLKLTNDLLEDLEQKEPVFIYFDELPVPFFIEKFSNRGNSGAIVKFESVNDMLHSEELVKKTIFIETSSVPQEALEELIQDDMGSYLAGFTLIDENDKIVGQISNYYDYPNNPCIEVIPEVGIKSSLSETSKDNEPILIPFQEQFIIFFDPQQRKICMRIPSGLITM